MAYNPGVQDISGQLLANGIMQGTSGLANGVNQAAQQQQLTTKEVNMLNGKVDAYQNMGLLSADDAQKFLQGSIAQKREIASKGDTLMAEHVRTMNNFTPSSDQLNAMHAAGYLWAQQSKGGGDWMKDPNAPLPPKPAAAPMAEPKEFQLPGGGSVVDLGNGQRQVVRAPAEKPMDMATANMLGMWQQQLDGINAEISEQTSQIAKGNKSMGILGLGGDRQARVNELLQQRDGLQAKIAAVQRNGNVTAATAGAPAAPAATGSAGLPAAAGGNAAGPAAMPRPATKAQRDALPPGTKYMAPDGTVRVRN